MNRKVKDVIYATIVVAILAVTSFIWIPGYILAVAYILPKVIRVWEFLLTSPGTWFTAEEISKKLKLPGKALALTLDILGTTKRGPMILRRVRRDMLDSLSKERVYELENETRSWFSAPYDRIDLFEFTALPPRGGKRKRIFLPSPKLIWSPQKA